MDDEESKISAALGIAAQCATIDGGHHKMWVIDQMVRALTGDDYAEWIRVYESPDDEDEAWEWDTGIAP